MPQKRNPVPIEHLRLLSSLTVGRADAMTGLMHNTPFTDMNDSEGEVQSAGYAAFESGNRALALLAALVPALVVDSPRVRRNIDAACITVTELADSVVRIEGLPSARRTRSPPRCPGGHSRRDEPRGGGYDAFRDGFRGFGRAADQIDADAFRAMTSPEHFVAVRDRFGGPAPAASTGIRRLSRHASSPGAALDRAPRHEAASQRMLDEAFDRLAAG